MEIFGNSSMEMFPRKILNIYENLKELKKKKVVEILQWE